MSESMQWSFSMDRCVRRCERQAFFRYVAAWHNARDPIRREAFLSGRVKTLDLWLGIVVHRGIELFVVPSWQERRAVDWSSAAQRTIEIAKRQFAFSAARRYRDPGMKKKDDYCALAGHETEAGISEADYQEVLTKIETSFANLSAMGELLNEINGRNHYWPELDVRVEYDAARINVKMDLLYFREFGKPTIIDWKVSEAIGGSDADLQTALYAWALCRHPKWGAKIKRAEDCELIEVQLLNQTVLRHRATEEIFDRLENHVYRSVNMMQTLGLGKKYELDALADYDFAANPNNCSHCGQRKLCQQLAIREPAVELEQKERQPRKRKKERSHAATYLELF